MSNSTDVRIATIEHREDGFYVHLSAFRDTRMISGRAKRRLTMEPKAVGPYLSSIEAEQAKHEFIQKGLIRPISSHQE